MILEDTYDVDYACDGVEAMEKIEANPSLSLVMLDLFMPNMDGFGLIEKIRQNESLKGIPVVAITADASSETDARSNLFSTIVLKPITSAKLQEIMENVFG